jgi:23S rRNA (guanosine2251-2'-O)-methyltransferase
VKAALENPARRIRRLYATENAARRLADDGVALPVTPEFVRPDTIAARLGPDAVDQGLLTEADPLALARPRGASRVRDRACAWCGSQLEP